MFTVQKIDTLELPELQPYRTMRRQEEHRQQGFFVAEGEKVVRRLIESRFEVVSVLLPEKWFSMLEPYIRARPELVRVYLAEKKLLERLTGFSMYQGLLAVGKVPPQPHLETILKEGRQPLLITAVDGLSSAENIGALVRNCLAFEADVLLVGETCVSPYLRRAVRSSMGAVFHLPIIECGCLAKTLQQLGGEGIQIVAAHPAGDNRRLTSAPMDKAVCIVFGSEGYGISERVLKVCTTAVGVPMPPTVDSLNVASAAAVFLYEASRQRDRL